jgi:LysR family transcriptional regulator, regulator for bpeEF and oprC
MSNNRNWLKIINLNHLPVFAAIVEAGSITAAARLLGSEKTRVSRILTDLENALGTKLAYRTTRHLRITEQGQALYGRCKRMIQDLEETTGQIIRQNAEISGHIRLTGAHGLVSAMLPDILVNFSRQHPRVTFEIILTQEALNLVTEGVDIALRIGHLGDSSHRIRRVGNARFSFAATPAFLRDVPQPMELESLSEVPTLAFPHFNKKPLTVNKPGSTKKISLRSPILCNSPDMILNLTLKNMGVGIVPEFICRDHFKTGQLVRLFEPWSPAAVPVSILFHDSKKKGTHVAIFLSFLASSIERQLN